MNPSETILPPSISTAFRSHPVGLFLVALVLFLAASPFVEMLLNGRNLEGMLATLFLATSIPAVGGRRRSLVATAALAAPVLFGFWFQLHRREGTAYLGFVVAFTIFLAFIIGRLLVFIFFAPRVTSEVLFAGVSVYLLLGLLWASAYAVTARLIPNSFTDVAATRDRLQGFEAIYFSLTTLTTAGFGDIAPVSGPARMLAMMEAAMGTLYLAVLVSRLVSLHIAGDGERR
jgi:hypothetical protein